MSAALETTRDGRGARPGHHVVLPGQTPEGEHILSALLKRSYRIERGTACPRAEKDRELNTADVPYGDPIATAIRYESDFVPFKLRTDVVVNGSVHAPNQRPVQSLRAALRIGPHAKELQVFGDRTVAYKRFRKPAFGDPEPFVQLPIRWERAYGGVDVDTDSQVPCMYARNHLGRAFRVKALPRSIDGIVLPNFEDPEHVLTPENLCPGQIDDWDEQPAPAGFGWYSKYWRPRALLAGVMPADRLAEQELRAMYSEAVPEEQREDYATTKLPDMNFEFFNGASAGLAVPYLTGDEAIETVNLHPDGAFDFELPGDRPNIELDIGSGYRTAGVYLHTVMIDLETDIIDLVWRAAFPYPGPDWLPEMAKMDVRVS